MLHNFLTPKINTQGINQQTMRLQQNGATVHNVRASMAVVQNMFPRQVISQHGNLPWPVQSLNPTGRLQPEFLIRT
jgi:hypothetical protein